MKFKEGDKVICVDNLGAEIRLKKGKIYVIKECRGEFLDLVDNSEGWFVNRFKLAPTSWKKLYEDRK